MSVACLLLPAAAGLRPQGRQRGRPCPLHVCAASGDAQWLSSFGRVLKEKAQSDLGRIFGDSTAKTREKLAAWSAHTLLAGSRAAAALRWCRQM